MNHFLGCNNDKVRCRGILHIVKPGDTLYKIGKMHGVPVSRIMYANPYVDIYNLQVGDEICVPVMVPCMPKGACTDSPMAPARENGMETARRSMRNAPGNWTAPEMPGNNAGLPVPEIMPMQDRNAQGSFPVPDRNAQGGFPVPESMPENGNLSQDWTVPINPIQGNGMGRNPMRMHTEQEAVYKNGAGRAANDGKMQESIPGAGRGSMGGAGSMWNTAVKAAMDAGREETAVENLPYTGREEMTAENLAYANQGTNAADTQIYANQGMDAADTQIYANQGTDAETPMYANQGTDAADTQMYYANQGTDAADKQAYADRQKATAEEAAYTSSAEGMEEGRMGSQPKAGSIAAEECGAVIGCAASSSKQSKVMPWKNTPVTDAMMQEYLNCAPR